MIATFINIGLAFVEGFALIISPCILPILPFILSGSLTGQKSRPLGIIVGFILTFTMVTLFSRAIIHATHISSDVIRDVSLGLLLLLGLLMMSSTLTEKFNLMTQRLTRVGQSLQSVNDPRSGFWSGVIFGGLVGIIWTPCAGPILAAVIVQVVLQNTVWSSFFTVIAFALGAGLPMLLIALIGRSLMDHFGFFRKYATTLRKVLGGIIVLSVVVLIFYGSRLSFSYSGVPKEFSHTSALINGLETPYPAPAISGIDAWINSPPLTLEQLRGKVVLIDFWTYSCINCLRTLPYLKDWYRKYHAAGFEIIGIHSPEFEFEHDLANVKRAVQQEGIPYPVALDNQFKTWQNFKNQYWPAHYLINKEGQVVYEHFGEGEYDVAENNIRFLLGMNKLSTQSPLGEKYLTDETPETYLGFARAENNANSESIDKNHSTLYHFPPQLAKDQWVLQGQWQVDKDKIVAEVPQAAIRLHFKASKVYAVMGTALNTVNVKILLDGKPVALSQISVNSHKLYSILSFNAPHDGLLELIALQKGLEIYTFTFGESR